MGRPNLPAPHALTPRLPRQLQNLDCTTDVFVSLNPHTPPEPGLVHKTLQYRHPQFSPRAEGGQRLLDSIIGKRGLWFCGAWRGYGFHEVCVYLMRCYGALVVHVIPASTTTWLSLIKRASSSFVMLLDHRNETAHNALARPAG